VRWAKGYNIDSVSLRALEAVASYVRDQPAHHPREKIVGWIAPSLLPESEQMSL